MKLHSRNIFYRLAMLILLCLSNPAFAKSPESLILAAEGEAKDDHDPIADLGRYDSPLFQSSLLHRIQFHDNSPLNAKTVAKSLRASIKNKSFLSRAMVESIQPLDDAEN